MYCAKCGQEMKDTDRFCPACGTDAYMTGQEEEQKQEQEPSYTPTPVYEVQEEQPSGSGGAVGALVCGIISLVLSNIPFACFGGIVLGIIAIIKGAKARKYGPQNKKGMATTGYVLGIIGLIISIIMTLVTILLIAFIGDHNSPLYSIPWDMYNNNFDL